MFERFTDRARKVMALANQEAQRFNHEYIGTEHILLGLLKEGSGVGANVLKNLGVNLGKARREVERLVKTGPEPVTMGKLPQTPRAKRVIEYATEESRNLHHNYVGTEHILLGLLRESDGVAAQVLMKLGLKLETVRAEVLNLLGAQPEAASGSAADAERAAGKELVKSPEDANAGRAAGKGLVELAEDDAVVGPLLQLLHEFEERRDQTALLGDHKLAAEYRELVDEVRRIWQRLGSILSRHAPSGD